MPQDPCSLSPLLLNPISLDVGLLAGHLAFGQQFGISIACLSLFCLFVVVVVADVVVIAVIVAIAKIAQHLLFRLFSHTRTSHQHQFCTCKRSFSMCFLTQLSDINSALSVVPLAILCSPWSLELKAKLMQ